MPYSLEIEIEGLPPLNSADALHWRTRSKHRKLWKNLVAIHAGLQKPKRPLKRARVHITRKSSGQCDPANLGEGAKFLLDGLVEAGVLHDDDEATIGMPILDQAKARPKCGSIVIRVEEIENEWIEIAAYRDDETTLRRVLDEIGAASHVQGAGLYLEPNELAVIYRVATGQMPPLG